MVKEWFLISILIVQTYSGEIDERAMRSIKQENQVVCQIEAKSLEKILTPQLGKDQYEALSNYDGTPYKINLGGKLIGFRVGCELRQKDLGKIFPMKRQRF